MNPGITDRGVEPLNHNFFAHVLNDEIVKGHVIGSDDHIMRMKKN